MRKIDEGLVEVIRCEMDADDGFEIKCPPMEWLSTKEKPLYLRGVVIDA